MKPSGNSSATSAIRSIVCSLILVSTRGGIGCSASTDGDGATTARSSSRTSLNTRSSWVW